MSNSCNVQRACADAFLGSGDSASPAGRRACSTRWSNLPAFSSIPGTRAGRCARAWPHPCNLQRRPTRIDDSTRSYGSGKQECHRHQTPRIPITTRLRHTFCKRSSLVYIWVRRFVVRAGTRLSIKALGSMALFCNSLIHNFLLK